MLARPHRLTRGQAFARAVRRGRRAGSPTVVLHLAGPSHVGAPSSEQAPSEQAPPAQVGFVVGKAVGGAVTRNEVRRRLRHIARDRLGQLPAGSLLVVRAQPSAAGRSSAELAHDVDAALGRLLGGRG